MTITFATEREMCAAFIDAVERRSDDHEKWTAYPETGGFDILLVRNTDGFQIGVEAKLRLNAKVVFQALPCRWNQHHGYGPDCRAVLVPAERLSGDLKEICEHLGVTIITVAQKHGYCRKTWENGPLFHDEEKTKPVLTIRPELPRHDVDEAIFDNWFQWAPDHRIDLPEVVPDCEAGCPSPLQLTHWKIKAIKIAVLLEKFGTVTRVDFKDLGIDPGRWTNGTQWLTATGKQGRLTVYGPGPNMPDFRFQHPKNYDEIAAMIDEWLPQNRREKTEGAA